MGADELAPPVDDQPMPSPAVPYADSGGVVVAEAMLATSVTADEVAAFGDETPPTVAPVTAPVTAPAVAFDPVVGDVLVGDDEHRSIAPPDDSAAGGTGLPAMFSDDYTDDADGLPPPPTPADGEFDFDDEIEATVVKHPAPHDEHASR